MESTRIWLPPTTTSLYSVMAYQHQTIHDFCLRSNIVYFPQRKVLIFFWSRSKPGTDIAHGKWVTGRLYSQAKFINQSASRYVLSDQSRLLYPQWLSSSYIRTTQFSYWELVSKLRTIFKRIFFKLYEHRWLFPWKKQKGETFAINWSWFESWFELIEHVFEKQTCDW